MIGIFHHALPKHQHLQNLGRVYRAGDLHPQIIKPVGDRLSRSVIQVPHDGPVTRKGLAGIHNLAEGKRKDAPIHGGTWGRLHLDSDRPWPRRGVGIGQTDSDARDVLGRSNGR